MAERNADPLRPSTVNEAVFTLLAELSSEHFDELRETEWSQLEQHYMGLARFIRNIFGLLGDNPRLLNNTGSKNPYDASMVILEALWRRLGGGGVMRSETDRAG